MYIGFAICLGCFFFGLVNALGFRPQDLVMQLNPVTERVPLRASQPWGTARSLKASVSSLVSIVAFFYTISSI